MGENTLLPNKVGKRSGTFTLVTTNGFLRMTALGEEGTYTLKFPSCNKGLKKHLTLQAVTIHFFLNLLIKLIALSALSSFCDTYEQMPQA